MLQRVEADVQSGEIPVVGQFETAGASTLQGEDPGRGGLGPRRNERRVEKRVCQPALTSPASIQPNPTPGRSTWARLGCFAAPGRQSGSTRPAASRRVLPPARVTRVRTRRPPEPPQPDPARRWGDLGDSQPLGGRPIAIARHLGRSLSSRRSRPYARSMAASQPDVESAQMTDGGITP